jgi:hypothetical protein
LFGKSESILKNTTKGPEGINGSLTVGFIIQAREEPWVLVELLMEI